MNKRATHLAASSAAIAMVVLGCRTDLAFVAPAFAATSVSSDQQAARFESQARAAMQRGELGEALTLAERAVEYSPRDLGYRMLLADLYMKNGRFRSAEASYGDVLQLDGANERAAISIALMQIAQGRTGSAMAQLEAIAGSAPASDVGLAMALAGQPARAIQLLEPAARSPQANGRTRQNLALAYALAGDWQRARIVAAQDISPAELNGRLQQWASMAQPSTPGAQVATLLNVTPQADAGQPTRLALLAPAAAPEAQAFAEAAPVEEAEAPVAYAEAAVEVPFEAPVEAPVQLAAAELPSPIQYAEVPVVAEEPLPPVMFAAAPAPAQAPAPAPAPTVELAQAPVANWWPAAAPAAVPEPVEAPVQAPEEVPFPAPVQPVPAVRHAAAVSFAAPPVMNHARTQAARAPRPTFQPERPRVRTAASLIPRAGALGQYVVQLGAFSNPQNAERAWAQAERRFGLANAQARTTTIAMGGRTLHRVSIGGFGDRAAANRLCGSIRTQGGTCFVRSTAGDTPVRWASRATRSRGA